MGEASENNLADAVVREIAGRPKMNVLCSSDDEARRLAADLKARGLIARVSHGLVRDAETGRLTAASYVRVSKKRDLGEPKRWSPFSRRDPLKAGPGCRRMPKDAWEKAGISDEDYRHALRLLRMIGEDWKADEKRDSFEAYDVARVLKAYRERYERAEAARKGGSDGQ